uniref:Uncharacterized protein n=1 Tax=Amphora coffeiformis TaxID=265554 RepID=A0A7S3P4M9_9STRA
MNLDNSGARHLYHAIHQKDTKALRQVLQQEQEKVNNNNPNARCDGHSKLQFIDTTSKEQQTPQERIVITFSPLEQVLEAGDTSADCLQVFLDQAGQTMLNDVALWGSLLHKTCQEGQVKCLRLLLEQNRRNKDIPNLVYGKPFLTPLHRVVQAWSEQERTQLPAKSSTETKQPNYAACFQLLLEYKANPARVDYFGRDVLQLACLQGLTVAVELLLSWHQKTNGKSNQNKFKFVTRRNYNHNDSSTKYTTALHAAASSGQADVLLHRLIDYASGGKDTLKKKLAILRDGVRSTPLHYVCKHNSYSVATAAARYLLQEASADPNARNAAGDTPLLIAVRDWKTGKRTLVTLLLEVGANVNVQERTNNPPSTAVTVASVAPTTTVTCHREKVFVEAMLRHGHAIQERRLINRGALKQTIQYAGQVCWTPLHYACFYGDTVLVQALLKGSADVHSKDARGRTPLCVTGLSLAARPNAPLLDMAVRLASTGDPLPLDGEDLSVTNNFVVRRGRQKNNRGSEDDEEGVSKTTSLLFSAGATISNVDADGNLPFAFACTTGADLTTIYRMVQAAGQDGLFDNQAIISKQRDGSTTRVTPPEVFRMSSSVGALDAPIGCIIL